MRPVLLLALLAACNPYDPNLGDSPFKCGTDEPRCPSGYVAVGVSPQCKCLSAAIAPDAAPPGYFCIFDPSDTADGRNDTAATAATVDVELNPVINLERSICPAGDEDHYALQAPRPDTLIVVRVTFDITRAAPGVDITNQEGASLMPTRGSEVGVVTAEHRTTYPGIYVVKVIAGEEVNYTMRLMVTPPG